MTEYVLWTIGWLFYLGYADDNDVRWYEYFYWPYKLGEVIKKLEE